MKVCQGTLIFFLGLVCLAANVVAPTKAELEAMYAAAAREVNTGNYHAALEKLDAIDARQPDMAAAHNLRGVTLMRLREFGPAETALRKARELDPDLWEARFNLAEVPFLRKNWAEARRRFEALAEGQSEEVQGATGDLIQFKILLTYLLEGKEKNAAGILERLQASSASPAYSCGQAALAFQRRDEAAAKAALQAAETSFSARLNQLFVESFYEVGWMKKPAGAGPVALEVDSLADRIARAQTDFRKAEQRYRQRDYEGALKLLDEVDANAPKQAISSNLRGEILLAQGELDGAEAAFRNALALDPQLAVARDNLARVPFRKGDYETARKQLEEILGATAGGKQGRQREQLIRYQIFLTLLLEGRDGAAQKAMDEFRMTDDSPALYYAQAAWAFRHGNATQGNNWAGNAGNLYSENLNRPFAAPLADLGWLGRGRESLAKQEAPLVAKPPSPAGGVSSEVKVAENPPTAASDTRVPGARASERSDAPARFRFVPAMPWAAALAALSMQADRAQPTPTPAAPELPKKITEKKIAEKKIEDADRQSRESASSNRKAARAETTNRKVVPPPPTPAPTPAVVEVERRPHNLGDVIVGLFRRRPPSENVPSPSPAPAESNGRKSVSPAPTRLNN